MITMTMVIVIIYTTRSNRSSGSRISSSGNVKWLSTTMTMLMTMTMLITMYRADSINLNPVDFVTATMEVQTPGRWRIECNVYDHSKGKHTHTHKKG